MLIKQLIFGVFFILGCMSVSALEITRYVSPVGTGDGMTPENPTSDLSAMLELGEKVDQLNLNVAPGFYSLNRKDDGEWATFKNIILDGSWNDEGSSDMVHINFSRVAFVNSSLYKVRFGGSATIKNGQMTLCEAENGQLGAILGSGDCRFDCCECKGFTAENWVGNNNDDVILNACFASEGAFGFKGKRLNGLYVTRSYFTSNKEGGCNIDGCKEAYFTNCDFSMNKGNGAVRLVEFDNSGIVYFDRCEFAFNEVTYNHQHNIYVHSNANFIDCFFAYNTEKDIDSKGIVNLARPDFKFLNCTFMHNEGAINLESFYPSENQIVNCAFWNNGKNNIYAGGREDVPLLSCAMDYATGIPELDAEKGIITLTEANMGFIYYGTEVYIEPTSILINRGASRPMGASDLYSHPRNAFGGTDIGCTEFFSAPGLWKPDAMQFTIDENPYKLCKTEMDGVNYYCILPAEMADAGEINSQSHNSDFIYLDRMPVAPKILEGKYVERHMADIEGGYLVDVLYKGKDGRWHVRNNSHYSTAKDRPTVKIVNNEVKFIKPVTTKNSTKAAKRSTTVTNKKHTAPKSRKGSVTGNILR